MEWWIWITGSMLFCIKYSRLFWVYFKKHGEDIDKPSIQIYVNKIENWILLKIKNGYSLELLTPETTKLLGSTKNKITKDKNGEDVPHLEIEDCLYKNEIFDNWTKRQNICKRIRVFVLC